MSGSGYVGIEDLKVRDQKTIDREIEDNARLEQVLIELRKQTRHMEIINDIEIREVEL